MRPVLVLSVVALVLTTAIMTGPGTSRYDGPAFAASILGKPKCHYVTKKVHGKKKRVKVCTKPKPTATPQPTAIPRPLHLIDASGYVWVDGAGSVYVSSGYLPSGANADGWVSKLSSTGAFEAMFRSASTLDGASGVAVDEAGNVYVADLGSDRVVKFSSSGTELASIGTFQDVPGQLSAPSGIGLDGAGHLYVADSNHSRIQEFKLDGGYVRAIGAYGPNPGQLENPRDVVVDGQGNLFVADTDDNRVEEFSPAGTVVTVWGTAGSDVGQFAHPKGIALDTAGNVYVADTGNRRVQKFTSDGTPLTQWSTGDYEPVSPGVDSAGNVFVTEDMVGGATGYGVAKYSPDGQLMSVWQ